MEILRKPPYPLTATYTVTDASSDYILYIKDKSRDIILVEEELESDADSKITYEIPNSLSKYDDSYSLEIYEASYATGSNDPILGDVVVEDNLEIVRPYVDAAELGTTASEIAEYVEHEKLARTIIDSITGGFYYYTDYVETVGQGTDYIPLWNRTYKILKVYENSTLVYDSSDTENGPALKDWNYLIIKDKSAITKDPVANINEFNRSEQQPPNLMVAPSDSYALFDTEDSGNIYTISPGVAFPKGYDYIFHLEQGYKVVPNDIKDATIMLINDIKCGKLDYYKRSVVNYSTDQFKIQIDKSALDGTGNILVDKILDKYKTAISKPGVL
jgi:hypothetical protein